MDKKVRIGVVGCGGIANGKHMPNLAKIPEVEMVAFCDIIPERAEAAVARYGRGIACTDYHDVINDPEVQAISVCTPNNMHPIISIDALRAGKHVLCEKPITVNYALSVEMAEEAKKQGKMLNIGVCNRYHKSVEMLEEMNKEGKFGNIYHVCCNFRAFRSIPGLGGSFTDKAQSGGGVLIDWGIHYLDLILYILGNAKLKNVTCDAYCEMAKDMKSYKYTSMWAEDTKDVENGVNDVDDFVSGYVRTDKASISLNGAWAQNVGIGDTYIDFLGDKGGARLTYGKYFKFWNGETLESESPEYEIPNMYLREDEAFILSAQTGVKDRNNIDNILESMKLLDSLYASSDAKKEITLD
jgi:predicted dehydrogenase